MIDPKAIDLAEKIAKLSAYAGDPEDGRATVARALLAEHERQERERCANCSYYLPRASGYPLCVSWGNDTDASDFCSHWKPVPEGVEP